MQAYPGADHQAGFRDANTREPIGNASRLQFRDRDSWSYVVEQDDEGDEASVSSVHALLRTRTADQVKSASRTKATIRSGQPDWNHHTSPAATITAPPS